MKVKGNHQLNLEDFFSRLTFSTLIEDFSDKENNMFMAQHQHQFAPPTTSNKMQVSIS